MVSQFKLNTSGCTITGDKEVIYLKSIAWLSPPSIWNLMAVAIVANSSKLYVHLRESAAAFPTLIFFSSERLRSSLHLTLETFWGREFLHERVLATRYQMNWATCSGRLQLALLKLSIKVPMFRRKFAKFSSKEHPVWLWFDTRIKRFIYPQREIEVLFSTPKNSPSPLAQSIQRHIRAQNRIPCLILCHRCERSARESHHSHHLIRQRDNILVRDPGVDFRGYMTSRWLNLFQK